MGTFLETIFEAHGGLDNWHKVERLEVRVSLTGALYRIKGYSDGVRDVILSVDTHRPAVTITPYARPDARGLFTPECVWIEDSSGHVVEERRNPLDSFAGHALQTPWDQLHRLYFTTYAMWNYLNTPFVLATPGVEIREGETHQENGETWRRLDVRFPSGIPTHDGRISGFTEPQPTTFFFSEQGLLQRLDYVAVGPASHYCFDHTTFGGFVFPTLRRVVRRAPSGPLVSGPTAVLLQIADVAVKTV